jgi:hypothetical protein
MIPPIVVSISGMIMAWIDAGFKAQSRKTASTES